MKERHAMPQPVVLGGRLAAARRRRILLAAAEFHEGKSAARLRPPTLESDPSHE
jgi:hypothetical protein